MKPTSSLLVLLLCLAVIPSLAQRGVSGGMQGVQGRQGMPGMQRGQNQASGMAGQMGQQNRERVRIHGTQPQQAQYRTCTQSMDRVRSQIRQMTQSTKGRTINRQQMQQLHQQLRNELRTIQQERQNLVAGFDPSQKAAVQDRLQQVNQTQADLDYLSEALGFELNQVDPKLDGLRDQLRRMDRTSKEL